MYNSGTWGMKKQDEDSFDSFHRQQLRSVLRIKYPQKISCKNIYKVTQNKTNID